MPTTEVTYNVTLSDEQKELITKQVIEKRNKVAACEYAGISFKTFSAAMEGGLLDNTQRDKLMNFCETVSK